MLTFKSLHGLAPDYISNNVNRYVPVRSLRSESKSLLTVPAARTQTYGTKRFDCAAAILWNDLPFDARIETNFNAFKRIVKTTFFRSAFY